MAAPALRGAAGAPGPGAPPRHLFTLTVTICAWCERRSIHGVWDDLEMQVMPLPDRHLITHGICPDCFHEYAPDAPYPDL